MHTSWHVFYDIKVWGSCLKSFSCFFPSDYLIFPLNQQRPCRADSQWPPLYSQTPSPGNHVIDQKHPSASDQTADVWFSWKQTFSRVRKNFLLPQQRDLWLTAGRLTEQSAVGSQKTLNCAIAKVPPLVSLTELWMCSLPVAQSLCSCDMSLRAWHMLSILWHAPPPPPLHLPVCSVSL